MLFAAALLTARTTPLFDPDEGYYPATAAESVAAGRAWDPQFNGAPRWDKPILTYALIEGSFAVFGRSVAAARLPSALEGAILVLIVGLVVSRVAGDSAARWSAAALAVTVGVQCFSRVAHPEIGVVLAVTAAELLLVAYLVTPQPGLRRRTAVLIGLALGYGLLDKGPVAVVLPALTLTAAWVSVRAWRLPSRRGWIDGGITLAVALMIALPWYVAMVLRHGQPFLAEAVWRHNVSRYSRADLGHRAGVFALVVPTLLFMLPWTAFLPAAVRSVRRSDRSPAGILRIVMACGAATGFVFYSLSASKLPHYALACVPPLAVLIGLHIDRMLAGDAASGRHEFRATALIYFALAVALVALPWLVGSRFSAKELFGGSPERGGELRRMLELTCWSVAAIAAVGAASILAASPRRRFTLMVGLGAVLPLALLLAATPLLHDAYPWDQLGGRVSGTTQPVWMVGPRAPSLTFFSGRPVARVTEVELSEILTVGAEGWIIVDRGWLHRAIADGRFPESHVEIREETGSMALAHVRCSVHPSRGPSARPTGAPTRSSHHPV
jgi:4-amino-4-deoxy-L-arabinose transferase-like glycosyltransferase